MGSRQRKEPSQERYGDQVMTGKPFRPIARVASLALCAMVLAGNTASAAVVVGNTEFARGAAAAKLAEQAPRILGKDADIYQKDVVQTGPRSFAIIGFMDAARVTVRPNTELTVKEYLEEKAELGLQVGGIRGASGAIAKMLPGQFKIETPVATVEIRNARFDVRYCEDDCAEEENALDAVENPELAPVVGRVATIRGRASAESPDGEIRSLGLGAPLHEKDVIKTESDSFALLVFRDSSKITLEASSEFHIEAQKYFENSPEKNEVIYRFMRGGMRALTGNIGKESPEKFQVSTPVATTGIRGTGFDLACRGDCTSERIEGSPEFITAAIPDGLYSLVWEGGIYQENELGRFDLGVGRAGYIANSRRPIIKLPTIPRFMQKNPAPRPDEDNSSYEQLFGTQAMNGVPRGLYVHVRWGHVRIITADGRTLDLGTGETGYAGTAPEAQESASPLPDKTLDPEKIQLRRLQSPRAFLVNDPYPKPEDANLDEDLFRLLDDDDFVTQQYFECICPL